MKYRGKIPQLTALFLCLALGTQVFAQTEAPPEDAMTQKIPLASPILLFTGTILLGVGTILWLSDDGSNQYWIGGVSLMGTGLASTLLGFAIGGTEDEVQYQVNAAIKEGVRKQKTQAAGATPAPVDASPSPAALPSPTPSPKK